MISGSGSGASIAYPQLLKLYDSACSSTHLCLTLTDFFFFYLTLTFHSPSSSFSLVSLSPRSSRCCSVRFRGSRVKRRNGDEETKRESDEESERGQRRLREAKRGSEILLIHRDKLRFRGNVVAIVTAPLRMPLVGNKKRMPLATCIEHTERKHNATHKNTTVSYIYTSYYTNTHRHSRDIQTHTHTHICTHPHSTLFPPIQLTTQHTYCCHFPTAHTGARTNADIY